MATKPNDLPEPTNMGLVSRYYGASQELEDERPHTPQPADDDRMTGWQLVATWTAGVVIGWAIVIGVAAALFQLVAWL
jgi:hypothetical protein